MLAFFLPPFFSDATLSLVCGQRGYVLVTMFDGLRITSEKVGNVLHTAMAEFLSFHGCVPTSVFFRQGVIEQLHMAFDGPRVGDHG